MKNDLPREKRSRNISNIRYFIFLLVERMSTSSYLASRFINLKTDLFLNYTVLLFCVELKVHSPEKVNSHKIHNTFP